MYHLSEKVAPRGRTAGIPKDPKTDPQGGPLLPVQVRQVDGFWTAECDALGLVTEAESYEALTERVWAIAPELAKENVPGLGVEHLQLGFQQIQSAQAHTD